MEIPPSIFKPIKKLASIDNSVGEKDTVSKLDKYLSTTFLREYFSKK